MYVRMFCLQSMKYLKHALTRSTGPPWASQSWAAAWQPATGPAARPPPPARCSGTGRRRPSSASCSHMIAAYIHTWAYNTQQRYMLPTGFSKKLLILRIPIHTYIHTLKQRKFINFLKKKNLMATKSNYFFVSAILVMFTSAMSYSRSGTAMPTTHIHTYISK